MAIGLLVIGVAVLSISGLQGEARLKRVAAQVETTARQSLMRAVFEQRLVEVGLDAGALGASGHLQVRRVGEKQFREPRTGEVWEFSPTGVCEPLEVRVTSPEGAVELGFDPLTGCARRKSVIVKG